MTTIAYCAADWKRATRAAAGTDPFTCPPLHADSHEVERLLDKATQAKIFYLNLHGYEQQPHLYGQANNVQGPTALTAEQVRARDWTGVVVFAEVCFSAANGGGHIAKAFLENGARAFIGSKTEAYGRTKPVSFGDGEADRLMAFFRLFYLRGDVMPDKALKRAKNLLRITSIPLDADDRATLTSFVCLENK